ncbi:MAG TPA: hypothetical protein VN524_10885 [Hyphomicrobiaceae bacterium]|nr:hypothetical protein [Hyphomicrobiaceae bacterium]
MLHESVPWPPRCTVRLERNSRGTNWSVDYACADHETALRIITEVYDRLERLYGSSGR